MLQFGLDQPYSVRFIDHQHIFGDPQLELNGISWAASAAGSVSGMVWGGGRKRAGGHCSGAVWVWWAACRGVRLVG